MPTQLFPSARLIRSQRSANPRGQGFRRFVMNATASLGLLAIADHQLIASAESEQNGGEKTQASYVARDASISDIYASMFGATQQESARLPYPVVIIGVNFGEAEIKPGLRAGETEINRRAFTDLILPLLTGEMQLEYMETLPKSETISTAQLWALGIDAHFNNANLSLEVDIPLEARAIVPIPLQRRADPSANIDLIPQANTSLIVNAVVGSQYIHASETFETGFANTQLNVEAALNHKGFVLETGVRYVDGSESESQRADTRLTKDFVERKVRVQAGDITVPTSGLQGNPQLAGVAGFTNFRLKPYEEFRANPSQQFELQRPARVSVFINNQFVRELRLVPGRYSLTDLPLRSAAGNDVVLEILYDSGDIERVVFSAFYDVSLLKKGVTEFAFGAGPTSQLIDGKRDYDTDNVAVTGFYRKGYTDRLTLGVNGQADTNHVGVGGEVLYATNFGTLGLLASHSDRDQGSGSAVTGIYRWNDTNIKRQARVALQARFQERNFGTLGNQSLARYKYDVAARASRAFGERTRLQASANWRKRHDRDDFDQAYTLQFNRQLGRGTINGNVRFEDTVDEGKSWSAGIGYTVRFGKGFGQFNHDTRNRATRASYGYQPRNTVGSLGYDIAYTRQREIDEVRAGLGYVGNRFDGRIEQRVSMAQPSDSFGSEHSTDVFLGSALVYADGKVAMSRPVLDSFAIFDTNKGAKDFEIAVDPSVSLFETGGRYMAKSSALGAAVVPDLQSYYVRTIEVDAPDAPAGTSIGAETYSLQPGYRGGYIVKVGTDRNMSVVSHLTLATGEPIRFATGNAIREDGSKTPFFTNGGGRFYIDGLKPGERVRIELHNRVDLIAEFQVPEEGLGVTRMTEGVIARPVVQKSLGPIEIAVLEAAPGEGGR